MEKKVLPNSTAVLVLGICSLVFGCFFVGFILGIIGIAMSGKGRRLYKSNPELYTGYGLLNAGYIMSIIGTVLGGIYVVYITILGGTALSILGHSAHPY